MVKAVYPGTFDPITNGHIDIVERASKIFSQVVIAVSTNPMKTPLFSVSQRVSFIRETLKDIPNVVVDQFNGLLVDYATAVNAAVLVRGLRAISDFEYEFQMALMNRKISSNITTVFLMPHEKYTYLNSTIVKELKSFGGDVSHFVPKTILDALDDRYK